MKTKTVWDIVEELGGCEYTLNPCKVHEIHQKYCRKCSGPCTLETRCRVCRAAGRILFLERR